MKFPSSRFNWKPGGHNSRRKVRYRIEQPVEAESLSSPSSITSSKKPQTIRPNRHLPSMYIVTQGVTLRSLRIIRRFHDALSVATAITLSCTIPANAYRHIPPTSTFAGLRAAQIGIEVHPTNIEWNPSGILKRLSEDPAICGWVEGNSGTFFQLEKY